MTHEMDVGSTQVGDEVRPRSNQGDEAEEIVGETDPGGDSAASLTRTRPKTALKPGEQMMSREADSNIRDGDGEWEGSLLQGELWQRNAAGLSDEPTQVSSSEGAIPVNDVGSTSPGDEERREQGATSDEHELTQLPGNDMNDAADAVGADNATEAAGPDAATDAATTDDAAGAVGAHGAMLTGDPGEVTVSVDAHVTVMVGDAGGHKLQAGSVISRW